MSAAKITLPVTSSGQLGNGSGSPQEILQPQLATYSDQYFYVHATDGVMFHAPCNGATTANSSNPRSEMREMQSGSPTTGASWGLDDGGTHTMTGILRIMHLPDNKPQLCVAQIHDASSDLIEILGDGFRPASGTTAATGTSSIPFCITWRWNGSSQSTPLIASYTMGEDLAYKIEVAADTLRIWMDKGTSATTLRVTKTGCSTTFGSDVSSGCYFKWGSYPQANSTNSGKTVPSGSCAGGADLTNPAAGSSIGGEPDTAAGDVRYRACRMWHA